MLCPVLISREAEMRALAAALDGATDGHGSMLFLTGDPGVGKSRLASEISSVAAERGFDVLTGRAVQSSIPVPFRPIAEALMRIARAGIVPHAPEIADYLPALACLVPEWGGRRERDAEVTPLILGEGLLRLLTLPSRRGALLVLEDLQWADPETLAIVEFLADNLAGKRVLCVATLRDGEPSPALEVMRSIEARRGASVIAIRHLSDREVQEMAAACLKQETAPGRVTKRLLANCDGLPFAVEEILAAAASSGELVQGVAGWQVNKDVRTDLPASIVGSVRNRLAALAPQASGVVVSAAVLGRHFDWTLLPAMTGMPEAGVLEALRLACELQLIVPQSTSQGTFRFRHSLTRDAIVSWLLPPDRARRSANAATAIEAAHPGLPGSWCELAAELHEAAGQQVQAARLMLEVGRRGLRAGALTSAAASLRDARALLDAAPAADHALDAEIGESLVQALSLTGEFDQLVPVAEELIAGLEAAGADPARQAMIRIRTARALSEHNPDLAATNLAAARATALRLGDPALASQVDGVAARCAIDAGDLDQASRLAHRALASAEAAGISGWAAEVAVEALEVIGRRERLRDMAAARTAFGRAYQIATDEELPIRRIRALHELGTIDMLADGRTDLLCEARELAHKAGAISTATVLDLQLANVWSLGGDLDRAMVAARQCQQSASLIGAQRLEAMAIGVQAWVAAIRAHRREMERANNQAERVLPGDPEIAFVAWGQARVTASLFLDDLPRALKESSTAVALAENAPMRVPRRAWGLYALLVAVSGEDGREAIARARAAGAGVRWIDACLAYAEAVVEGREGQPERATALAEAGNALFTAFAPWWNHLARRLVAPAALQDGWGQPIAWLREAASELDMSGHTRLASACRGILRRAGERVPRSGRGAAHVPAQMRRLGVTSREMDVFLLVARGFSNAEIAARLFVSPKTVETHIASLVAKTGQSGRRELVAHAARFAPTEVFVGH